MLKEAAERVHGEGYRDLSTGRAELVFSVFSGFLDDICAVTDDSLAELHDEKHQPDIKNGSSIGMPLAEFTDEVCLVCVELATMKYTLKSCKRERDCARFEADERNS